MPIPGFQDIMLPLLQFASDGQEHTLREATQYLSNHFQLSKDERNIKLPSGRQARFANRVGWSKTYLKKTGLIANSERGKFRITEEGLRTLKQNPLRIDLHYLRQFPGFAEFHRASISVGEPSEAIDPEGNNIAQTPEEQLDMNFLLLRKALEEDLLERLKSCPSQFFEQLVIDVLVAIGYGGPLKDAGKVLGQSGDDGIDGIINEDKLGLDVVYIQAKRWENPVGRPVVQAFAGSLEGQRARKGILLTTARFTPEAREYVKRIEKRIVLIDGEMLAQLMIDYNVGVSVEKTYTIKRIDHDYFNEYQVN